MFALFQTSVGFQLGYVFCYTNQINPALQAKFNWMRPGLMESIVGSSATLTLMVGSYFAGILMKRGRRRVLILAAIIGSIGAGITIIQRFYAIIVGRLIYGFSCGLIAITMPRVMEETIPGELVGVFGGLYCLSFAFATLVAYGMAAFLPPESQIEQLAVSPVT